MSRETQVWAWLAKAKRALKTDLDMNRIENPAGPGMPDVEGHLRAKAENVLVGGQFWIELKSAARPKHETTPVRFKVRPKQVAWLRRRYALAGNAFMLLQVGSGHERKLYLLAGDCAHLVQRGMPEIDLSLYAVNTEFGRKLKPEDVIRMAASK